MKIKYFVHCYKGYDVNDPYNLFRYAITINSEGQEFGNYLTSALSSDLTTPEFCAKILAEIELVERGELKDTWFGGQDFYMDITLDGVRFEHAIFGECPEWPIWHCSLAQYKAAVQGWKKFLEMPKSIDSELIVELPE